MRARHDKSCLEIRSFFFQVGNANATRTVVQTDPEREGEEDKMNVNSRGVPVLVS